MEKILIVGGGEIGQAITYLLANYEPVVVDQDKTKSNTEKNLTEAVQEAEIIFLALPTRALEPVLSSVREYLDDKKIIVSLSKGVGENGDFPFEIIGSLDLGASLVVLGGPMLAEEILQGKTAGALVASDDVSARVAVKNLFNDSHLKILESADPKGVVLAGVFKNIYTLGLSVSEALESGDNMRGLLLATALSEMSELITSFGGEAVTAYSLAGAGDLVATSLSSHSRNKTVGEQLVRDGKCCITSEASLALPLLWPRLESKQAHFPFLSAIVEVVVNNKNAKNVFSDNFFIY